MTIFHIAHCTDWAPASSGGSYSVGSLESEGFIHLSTRDQVLATAGRYYRGVNDLVLLAIDESALDQSLLRFEASTGGELYPHYYARLPVDAVEAVAEFVEGPDGFDWPISVG